jgi:integrase
MPKKRPIHLETYLNRHGKRMWYFRAGKGKRIRIHGEYGSPAFQAAYKEALAAHLSGGATTRTLAWLIEEYRRSPAWERLAAETKKQFRYQLERMKEKAGEAPITAIKQASIVAGRDARAAKPSDANKYLRASKRLFAFAVEHGWLRQNPATGVSKVPLPNRRTGFLQWEEEDLARYEEHWQIGTRERLALDLLLYTGVRRSDLVRLGRQHMRQNGEIVIRTEKSVNSGRPVEVTITILPPLAASIQATRTGDLTFLITARGKPFVKESFGNWFKKACKAAGVNDDGKASHGLRKVAATRAAEAGATEAELNAMFGWTEGSGEAAHYIRKANRAKLARSGQAKVIAIPLTNSRTDKKGIDSK